MLKYSDHDVAYDYKFSELAKRVVLHNTRKHQVGEPINYPHQWEIGLEKT
jgi:hypothetical protein